jgi:hypothetical protein
MEVVVQYAGPELPRVNSLAGCQDGRNGQLQEDAMGNKAGNEETQRCHGELADGGGDGKEAGEGEQSPFRCSGELEGGRRAWGLIDNYFGAKRHRACPPSRRARTLIARHTLVLLCLPRRAICPSPASHHPLPSALPTAHCHVHPSQSAWQPFAPSAETSWRTGFTGATGEAPFGSERHRLRASTAGMAQRRRPHLRLEHVFVSPLGRAGPPTRLHRLSVTFRDDSSSLCSIYTRPVRLTPHCPRHIFYHRCQNQRPAWSRPDASRPIHARPCAANSSSPTKKRQSHNMKGIVTLPNTTQKQKTPPV